MNLFEQTPPSRRRYGLAAFIGLIAGIVSAFVKWGAEVPLPPRSPADLFTGACGPEQLIRAAGQIDCSRNFLNPPYVFLRDWLGVVDPNAAVYTFAGHIFNCQVYRTFFPSSSLLAIVSWLKSSRKLKLWQGLLAGALAHFCAYDLLPADGADATAV